jgi:hypothetical protein
MNIPFFIANNFSIKLVSLAMASLLWLYVISGTEVETMAQLPVVFSNLSDDLTVVDKPPVSVKVIIRGTRLAMMTFSDKSLKLILDMSGVSDGRVVFSNLEDNIRVPRGMKVTRVQPDKLEISLARLSR